jgi:hypothetical protein
MVSMARVRTIRVGDKRYLQVVENTPSGSIDVLQSFGEYGIENWLRANQFAISYNQLRDLAAQPKPSGNPDEFFRAALAIFGVVLGAAIVASLLGED